MDHARPYTDAKDVMELHLGSPVMLYRCTRAMPDYDKNDRAKVKKCTNITTYVLYAYVYLEVGDQAKCSSILRNLILQKSLGNGQHPNTQVEDTNVLSIHRIDNINRRKNKGGNDND